MSNYPPGVSGFELEIAGPDYEKEIGMTCHNCPYEGDVEAWFYGGVANFECPSCGTEGSVSSE
jgi:hypothetical protein